MLEMVDDEISNIYDFFSLYTILFERKAKETKAGSYGGYEISKMVGEFNKAINDKSTELLEKVSKLFQESGRTLSEKQYDILLNKCHTPFERSIDDYKKVFRKEFESNDSIEISLDMFKSNVKAKINKRIRGLKVFINTKLDKALWWTAIGTVFAGVSLILSVVAIIVAN